MGGGLVGGLRAVAAGMLACALLAVAPAPPAGSAEPCVSATLAEVTWTGAVDNRWANPLNWNPLGVPNDRNSGDKDTLVCIPAGASVVMDEPSLSNVDDAQVEVEALHLGAGATVQVGLGVGLLAMSPTVESVLQPGSRIDVSGGTVGGEGTLRVRGTVSVRATPFGASSISSTSLANNTAPQTGVGTMIVEPGGRLELPELGVNLLKGYRVRASGAVVVSGTGYLAVDADSVLDVRPGGVFELAGSGGFYESPGPPGITSLVNDGTIVKSGRGTTSVIGSDYSQTGAIVVTGGTLAFAGGTTYSAAVAGGQRLSTEKCAALPSDRTPCQVETDPTKDPAAISLQVPRGDANGAQVVVDEVSVGGIASAGRTARAGSPLLEGIARADGVRATAADPAVVQFRVAASLGGRAPADWLTVDQGAGPLPSCAYLSGAPPSGASSCVARALRDQARPVTRLAPDGNYYVVVHSIAADRRNRWIISRQAGDATAPVLTTPRKQKRGSLGATVKVRTGCAQECTVKATGTITVKGAKKKIALTKVVKRGVGAKVTLKLSLSRAAKRALARTGADKGTAKVTVVATDAGGRTKENLRVTLR